MKRSFKGNLSIIFVCVFAIHVWPAMAAKPLEVIELSNGYPSGPHYNLNIHGKKADYVCDETEGGNSVFINEYGDSTISYVSNKKSSVIELVALDKCAEDFDGDAAQVQLPSESLGYYVFATIKGKPNNGSNSESSGIILSPNLVREACNDIVLENPDFPTYTECPDSDTLVLGLIVGSNTYEATDVGFVRFDNSTAKGKSKAVDISSLFRWTGYVFDDILDISGDGKIDELDVPLDYDTDTSDASEYEEYLIWVGAQVELGFANYYENEWILNIADLVVTDQAVSNDGTKLLKIRFYPVATTEYVESESPNPVQ
jgi:hypothetical protein